MRESVIRAAVVQASPILFDTPRTIEKVAALTREASTQGAQLVVFPEAFVGGYPKGLDFGARMGTRSAAGREDFQRYFESSIAISGVESAQLCEIAHVNKVYLVIGIIEREGSTLYCTACLYSPEGALVGNHRKLMPTAMERLVWGVGDGSTLAVADTAIGKIGSVICWENYMPLLRMAMYAQGVEIYCAPTVDDRETWLPSMRMIALEGRCFVVSACQYLTRGDCPQDYSAIQGDDPSTVLIGGGSCIVDPMGNVLVAPVFDKELIQIAELDKTMIPRGKYDLDVAGHYARPDIFRFTVNTREQKAAFFESSFPLAENDLGDSSR